MSERYITQVEEKLDKVCDEIYAKVKNMSWPQYKDYLNRRTLKFGENLGVKIKSARTPGVYTVR